MTQNKKFVLQDKENPAAPYKLEDNFYLLQQGRDEAEVFPADAEAFHE